MVSWLSFGSLLCYTMYFIPWYLIPFFWEAAYKFPHIAKGPTAQNKIKQKTPSKLTSVTNHFHFFVEHGLGLERRKWRDQLGKWLSSGWMVAKTQGKLDRMERLRRRDQTLTGRSEEQMVFKVIQGLSLSK